MSFYASVTNTGETCDKCRKPMTEDRPGITLYASTKESGYQTIWIHESCLEKAIKSSREQGIEEVRP
jgi:hypothetical protein